MEPVDLQFFAFFVVVLTGALLGFLFDILRAIRGHYRPSGCVAAAGDFVFWLAATAALAVALLLGNWGEFRFFMIIGLGLGLGLHYTLASSITIRLAFLVIHVLEWIWDTLMHIVVRLVIGPVRRLASLLLALAQLVWEWALRGGSIVLTLAEWVGILFWRPLRSLYRLLRLRYLLAKRRIKRRLRKLLLPPPDDGPHHK